MWPSYPLDFNIKDILIIFIQNLLWGFPCFVYTVKLNKLRKFPLIRFQTYTRISCDVIAMKAPVDKGSSEKGKESRRETLLCRQSEFLNEKK